MTTNESKPQELILGSGEDIRLANLGYEQGIMCLEYCIATTKISANSDRVQPLFWVALYDRFRFLHCDIVSRLSE